jgi:hypothetical protein
MATCFPIAILRTWRFLAVGRKVSFFAFTATLLLAIRTDLHEWLAVPSTNLVSIFATDWTDWLITKLSSPACMTLTPNKALRDSHALSIPTALLAILASGALRLGAAFATVACSAFAATLASSIKHRLSSLNAATQMPVACLLCSSAPEAVHEVDSVVLEWLSCSVVSLDCH